MPEECLFCAAPHEAAPDLLGWHKDKTSDSTHCLFKKQPVSRQEIADALDAMNASCIENLRYGGRDPRILELLEAMGLRRLCDHPVRWWQRLGHWFRK
jgi:hypothetical protein